MTMAILSNDVLMQIFSYTPHPTLMNCRLINRAWGCVATTLAFPHVRLEATRIPSHFLGISESAELRVAVRELTVDACPPDPQNERYYVDRKKNMLLYRQFLLMLPRIRLFTNLRVLNLRLPDSFDPRIRLPSFMNPLADPRTPGLYPSLDACEELLSAVLDCLAGEWTAE